MSMLRRITVTASLFFVALLVFVPMLNAQLSTRATITGTVTDSAGAVVQGATVTITDDATKVATKTQTNNDGVYVAPGLTVDIYTVTFAKAGFKSYTVTGVELHPTETVAVNGVFSVGAQTQTVTVQATSTQVETSTPEVSADIDAEQVSTLPMNGRNYQALAVMMPGVTNLQQGSAMTTGGRSTNSQLSINGLDVSRSFYVLDGVWNENTGNMQQTSVVPNPDSLEEVRVLQNNFSAQYSLMGSSVVIAQTKSGTANFHATAWDFVRNTDLNTRPYFTPVSTGRPNYHQNIFGYNVGGPVFIPHHYNSHRQKTFFFWDEQFVILHVPNQTTSTIPTALERTGCFISPMKNPATGVLLTPLAVTTGGCPAGYYQVPNTINTSSAAYINTLYPLPNYVLAGNTANYINLMPLITDQRDDEIKIDHNITPKYHAFAEYFDEYQKYAQNTESPGTTPISTETDYTHNKLAQVSLTQTLSPSMVNTTNIAMNIFLLNLTLVGKTDINDVPGFAETFFYPTATYASRTPVVNFSNGIASQGIQAARPIPHASDLDNTVSDNWSWLHGKHYVTAGVTFVWNTKRQISGQQTNGSLTFNGNSSALTGPQKTANPSYCTGNVTLPSGVTITNASECNLENSISDMLQGYIGSFNQTSQAPHGEMHGFSISPYVEDQFKMNKNWTFTAGLRLYDQPLPHGLAGTEYNWGAGVVPGNMYANPSFNPTLAPTVNEYNGATNIQYPNIYSNGMLLNSGTSTGLPVNFSNAHRWYFGPDAGFAWDVFGNGKTSLRGGFGMSYTRIFTNQDCSFNCIANPPVFATQNFSNLVLPRVTALDLASWNVAGIAGPPADPGAATGALGNAESVQSPPGAADYNIQSSPVASYSLGIQHEFPMNITVSVVGAGSRLQHLVGTWNWNQAPHYLNTTTGVAYDYNPLIAINPANGNKGDNSAYYAPYQGYGSINVMSTRLWQEWNGLEAQVKHPVTKSLYLSAAYTWSHDTSNSVVDPYNLLAFHGNNGLNYPQSFAITVLYELPFFRNDHGIKNVILGGWRINDISTFRSGSSLTPGITLANGGLTNRPFVVPGVSTNGPKTWKNGSTKQWFNEAAYLDPRNPIGGVTGNPLNATLYYGYYGNAQNGTILGPGQEVWNLSLFKEFHYKTNVLEFRGEAFNLFNHANPSNPNTSIGNANENTITNTADPRILELALRYKF
jgi:hypothetical protein